MIIDVDARLTRTPITLNDADNFRELKLVAHSESGYDKGVRSAIDSLGRWAGTHAFIQPEVIRALAGDAAHDEGWRTAFDGMISYAAAAGWIDEVGAVRVHIEHTL